MKKILFLFFVFLCVCVYSAEYEFNYITLPTKIDYKFKFDIQRQKQNNISVSSNIIEINSQKQNNKYIAALFDEKNNLNKKDFQFSFDCDKKSLKTSILDDTKLYPNIDFSEDLLSSQFILPNGKIKVGDIWLSKIKNPLSNEDLSLECRLVRVADNIATVYFNIKSPFSPRQITTEKELMETKIHDGSTFYFEIERLFGYGEVSGSGLWIFDLEKGALLSSDHFYKITSLMGNDSSKEIKSAENFTYVDVTMNLKYKFSY